MECRFRQTRKGLVYGILERDHQCAFQNQRASHINILIPEKTHVKTFCVVIIFELYKQDADWPQVSIYLLNIEMRNQSIFEIFPKVIFLISFHFD